MGKTYRGEKRDIYVKAAKRRELTMQEKTFSSDKDFKRQPKHRQSYNNQKG